MKKINILIFVILSLTLIGCNLDNAKNRIIQNQTSQVNASQIGTSQIGTSQIGTSQIEGSYKEISYSENETVANYVKDRLPGLLKNFLIRESISNLISREVDENSLILGIPSDVTDEEFNEYIKRIGENHEYAIKKDILSDFTNINIANHIKALVKGTINRFDYTNKVIESVNKLVSSDEGLQIRNIGDLSVKEKDDTTEIKINNLNLKTIINYLYKHQDAKVYEYDSEKNIMTSKTLKEFVFSTNSKGEENSIAKLIKHIYNSGRNIEIYDTSLTVKNILTEDNYDINKNYIIASALEDVKGTNLIEFELKARVNGSEVKIVCISTVNSQLKEKEKQYIQGKEVDVYSLDKNLETTFNVYSEGISLDDIEEKIKSILGL